MDVRFWYAVVMACAVLAMSFLFWQSWDQSQQLKQEVRNRCVSVEAQKTLRRQEYQNRIDQSWKFLKAHPNGVDGITRVLVLQGIKQAQDLKKAEKALPCRYT